MGKSNDVFIVYSQLRLITSPHVFLLQFHECATLNKTKINLEALKYTFTLDVFNNIYICPSMVHYSEAHTYTKPCRVHEHTNTQKQTNTHTFVEEDTNFKCSSFLARKKNLHNLIGFWERFDISLPWWSCLVGRERTLPGAQ